VSEKSGESRREHFHFFLAIFQQSDAHKVYENDSNTETESNQDLPREEPPGGSRKEHLYRFSQFFDL